MRCNGYLSKEYAESFGEIGRPQYLTGCGGWIIERPIPGTMDFDAMGCYPLFLCNDWSKLPDDISELEDSLVSLSFVTDPFGKYDLTQLRKSFPDRFALFKQHFVIDLSASPHTYVSKNHRRNARIALQVLTIEQCQNPKEHLLDWVNLYQQLIMRHNITGVTNFSEYSFIKQFDVPGIVLFRAPYKSKLVGMLIWYVHEDRAYYHLGAFNDLGYKLAASFGLFWHSIEYFQGRVRWLGLGAGAGLKEVQSDGLARFKRGWSNQTRDVYFCGRILSENRYFSYSPKIHGTYRDNFFPSYRKSEYLN